MNEQIKKRVMRTALLSVIALIIGIGVGYYQISQNPAVVTQKASKPLEVAGIQIGGPFELVHHNGQTVTQDDFAGQYKLIYFGFTYCPAICPTELQKISQVLGNIGPLAERVQPLFITIDPERDTPEVMADYVSLFDKRLVGLTGSQAQIDAVKKSYRVFANKVQTDEGNDYTMDHSSFIYLMDPQDKLQVIYRIEDQADFIAKDLIGRLQGI